MTTNKNDIELIRKRINEAYLQQILAEPEKPCFICNWSKKYEYSRIVWKQRVEELEAEVRRLKIDRKDIHAQQLHR